MNYRGDIKSGLRFYFELAIGSLSSDQQMEIDQIVDNIIDTTKSEIMADLAEIHKSHKPADAIGKDTTP